MAGKTAPREKYLIKGMEIEEWQIVKWTYKATLTPFTFREDGKLEKGETYTQLCTDGVYIVKGLVYYGTNGGYVKINGVHITPEYLDQDENSQIKPTDKYMTPPWKLYDHR